LNGNGAGRQRTDRERSSGVRQFPAFVCLSVDSKGRNAMSSKKLDAAIDALVDALAELPEHELEG
jgi:hypothetical protein